MQRWLKFVLVDCGGRVGKLEQQTESVESSGVAASEGTEAESVECGVQR